MALCNSAQQQAIISNDITTYYDSTNYEKALIATQYEETITNIRKQLLNNKGNKEAATRDVLYTSVFL